LYWDIPTPEEAIDIPNEELRSHPFFQDFLEADLTDEDLGSELAKQDLIRFNVLASGIPALSFAAAANPVDGVRDNFNMQELFRTDNEWPQEAHEGRKAGNWVHSDFYNVALSYVYQMYDQMIETADLDAEP
jgi:hypothetical protein|tara:strand:+ start:204 stop:599 length:396 start_codon:yes stop_codon:yes gene_type:complete